MKTCSYILYFFNSSSVARNEKLEISAVITYADFLDIDFYCKNKTVEKYLNIVFMSAFTYFGKTQLHTIEKNLKMSIFPDLCNNATDYVIKPRRYCDNGLSANWELPLFVNTVAPCKRVMAKTKWVLQSFYPWFKCVAEMMKNDDVNGFDCFQHGLSVGAGGGRTSRPRERRRIWWRRRNGEERVPDGQQGWGSLTFITADSVSLL